MYIIINNIYIYIYEGDVTNATSTFTFSDLRCPAGLSQAWLSLASPRRGQAKRGEAERGRAQVKNNKNIHHHS